MSELLITVLICIAAIVISFICGEQLKNYTDNYVENINDKQKSNISQIKLDDIKTFAEGFVEKIINNGATDDNKNELITELTDKITSLIS